MSISGASPRKSGRPLSPQTVALMNGLRTVLAEQNPSTVRGAFYAAEVLGLVDKSEAGYKKVQRLLMRMRDDGLIPWRWIADGTRYRRGPDTFNGVDEALRNCAALYRRDLWAGSPEIVEVWLEKDALSGVVQPVTDEYAVDLMVTRGYPSASYLYSAAEYAADRPLRILYLGDCDPSGRDIPRSISDRLEQFGCEHTLDLVAVTDEQIEEWQLPTRPTKRTDTRSQGFAGRSVELDAIPAPTLRQLVEDAILRHADLHQLDVLRTFEREERQGLLALAEGTAA